MSKRIKYLISSILSAIGFWFFLSLPYESHYYGLLVGVVLTTFCFWFGLGIIFENDIYTRIMSITLPVGFFIGFGLFAALLPSSLITSLITSLLFGVVIYVIFLVENVFLVAIGSRTPPLYRAAYTVSLMMLLLTAFFLFNSLFSFKFYYWLNTILVFVISLIVFLYHFYAVTIELPDDGKQKNIVNHVLIPSVLMAELGLVFSFWPVGIFKGSIYLVTIIYILSGLLQADLRERLFKRTWLTFVWIGVAIFFGILLNTSWR
ncbi:MAG: hypothetical protein WCG91_02130 [Candidatus Shapirobacteria bacterium]